MRGPREDEDWRNGKVMHHCLFGNVLVSGATDIDRNNHSLVACYGAISLLGMLASDKPQKGRVSANTYLVLPPCVGVASSDLQTCSTECDRV